MASRLYDFFHPGGDRNGEYITTIGTSWQYWMIVFIAISSISLLFIFKKSYLRLAKAKIFRYMLGYFQLSLYFLYYFLHFLYLYGFDDQHKELRGWMWIFPFHLSSITQIFSAILLIKPNNKLFSISGPWVIIMVFASILIPATKSAGPQHLFFWMYYIIHIIILFTYWFIYMYGLVEYEKRVFGWSFIFLTLFALIALCLNAISLSISHSEPRGITNFLFIGKDGYPLWNNITTSNIWPNKQLWPLGFLFIFIFGTTLLFISHLVLAKIRPFYLIHFNNIVEVVQLKKQPWDFLTFRMMFIYVRHDIIMMKNRIKKNYESTYVET